MNKKITILIIVIATITLVLFFYRNKIIQKFYMPTETKISAGVMAPEKQDIEIMAENLEIPWDIAFLPNDEMLVTERSGNLIKIGQDKKKIKIEGVEHIGEGGLLGVALHPDFSKNSFIYLYFTTKSNEGLKNRIERYRLNGNSLSDKKIIINDIPGAAYHDGGKISFGPALVPAIEMMGTTADKPDYYLYVTTGDAGKSNLAQDINSLAGKILRMNDDGSIPNDNPFNNAVYSYGHRNPQGLAWDNLGRLWATEHGRSGILSGLDELNLIEKGANYGWPSIQGNEAKRGMKTPIINSGPDETWAPAAATYFNKNIFFTGLRGESLYQVKISPDGAVEKIISNFRGEFGRLRALTIGPDRYFYLSTSNTDGRGEPKKGDDKIIRINPRVFNTD